MDGKIKRYVSREVTYVSSDATLSEVAETMSKNMTDVVVVRRVDDVVGMISASDLFHAMRAYLLGANYIENIPEDTRGVRIQEIMLRTKAKEFMDACGLSGTNLCIRLNENDTIANAIRLMTITSVKNILIFDEEEVVGTQSESDVIKAFSD